MKINVEPLDAKFQEELDRFSPGIKPESKFNRKPERGDIGDFGITVGLFVLSATVIAAMVTRLRAKDDIELVVEIPGGAKGSIKMTRKSTAADIIDRIDSLQNIAPEVKYALLRDAVNLLEKGAPQ